MSGEQNQVLRLLEQGLINYEEALALLRALGGIAEGGMPPQRLHDLDEFPCACGDDDDEDYDHEDDFEDDEDDDLKDVEEEHSRKDSRARLGDEVSSEVRAALREAGSEVNSALNEVGEELRNLGRSIDLPGLLQGIFSGASNQHQSWQESKEISVDSSLTSLALAITNKNGHLRLLATDAENITVRLKIRLQADSEGEARKLAAAYIQEQETIKGDQLQLNWLVTEQIAGSVSFEILIPRRLLVTLDLSSKNGSVRVENVQASGKIVTKNGSVTVDETVTDELEVETKNGSIAVRADIGALTASSKNGSIRCTLKPVRDGKINLAATNGSVHAELVHRDDIGYEIDATTRSGRVAAEWPGLALGQKRRDHISGSTANWEQARIKTQVTALTRNGNIDLSPR